MNATVIHGFGRFSVPSHFGDFEALSECGCSLLEIVLVDLDDHTAFGEAYAYANDHLVTHNKLSMTLSLMVAIQLGDGGTNDNAAPNTQLRDMAELVPTVYVESQKKLIALMQRLTLMIRAMQGETLCTLDICFLKAALGLSGTFNVYGGYGKGINRVKSAWTVAAENANLHDLSDLRGTDVDCIVVVLSGTKGDLRLSESRALEEMIVREYEGLPVEVSTSYGDFEPDSLHVTVVRATQATP